MKMKRKGVKNKGKKNVRNEKVSKFIFNFGLKLCVFLIVLLYLTIPEASNCSAGILRFLKLVT
jgi:hypothetical protein